MSKISVLLADDHAMLLDGMAGVLQTNFEIIGTVRDGRDLIKVANQKRPEVIVTDITMPSLNGIDAARILRREGCSSKIIFLTMHADLLVVEQALRAGGAGFILKICAMEEFVKAIQTVATGATYITPLLAGDLVSSLMRGGPRESSGEVALSVRQREVLQLLAEGKTMKETAAIMGISTRTAESHKYEIMRLLGVETPAALIRYAVRIKLV